MRRVPRVGWLVMLLVIALAGIGIGWTLWFKTLTISGVVETGRVHAGIVNAFTDDDDVVNDTAKDSLDADDCADIGGVDIDGDGLTSCDPAACGRDPKPRYDKDVARCDAAITDDPNKATVTKRNVYPSYHCTAWFDIVNDGTIPVKVAAATINGKPLQPGAPTPFDLSGDGLPDVEIEVPDLELCKQIDPGDEPMQLEVRQHVLQEAPQGASLTYTLEVQLNQWNEPCPPPQPVFEVTAVGATPEAAVAVAEALGLPTSDILMEDGSLLYIDPEKFQAVPTKPAEFVPDTEEDGQETVAEAFDFDALMEMQVYDEGAALGRSLAAAQVLTITDVAMPSADHSMFEWTMDDQGMVERVPIDTHVNFGFELNGLPVVGPGAKGKVAFDSEGEVSLLRQAWRDVRRGDSVEIMAPGEAQEHCAESFFDVFTEISIANPESAQLNLAPPRLLYYAPSLAMDSVQRLYPHYECGGTAMVNGQEIILQSIFVPAIEDVPQVELSVKCGGEPGHGRGHGERRYAALQLSVELLPRDARSGAGYRRAVD